MVNETDAVDTLYFEMWKWGSITYTYCTQDTIVGIHTSNSWSSLNGGLLRYQGYTFTAESLGIGVCASWSLSVEKLVEGPVQWRDDTKDNSPTSWSHGDEVGLHAQWLNACNPNMEEHFSSKMAAEIEPEARSDCPCVNHAAAVPLMEVWMNEFLLGRCLIKTSSVLLNALEVFGEVCQTAEEEPMLALKKTFQGSESNVPPLP